MIGEKNYGGELLGPFRLVAECGCGPAGCVYQARPISMARPSVAIKWFHTVRLSPHQCRQFLLAVRLLKKLKHPHILPLLDAGFHEGLLTVAKFIYLLSTLLIFFDPLMFSWLFESNRPKEEERVLSSPRLDQCLSVIERKE